MDFKFEASLGCRVSKTQKQRRGWSLVWNACLAFSKPWIAAPLLKYVDSDLNEIQNEMRNYDSTMQGTLESHCDPRAQKLMHDVDKPVPNLLKGCLGFPVAFSNWKSLQASFITFFSCSESTALTSLSLQLASNKGHRKNWANLRI